MPVHAALNATTRVALAAYLHDIGKLAERAGAFPSDQRLEANLQLYCPYHEQGRWFSHKHAAYSALAIDLLADDLPDLLLRDPAPFTGRQHADEADGAQLLDATDSFINAAAAHHKPKTFLQWVIATADRVASGFERDEFDRYNNSKDESTTGRNHYQARQLTLFEQIDITREQATRGTAKGDFKWRYPLEVMSPNSIFPQLADQCEPSKDTPAREQYLKVWNWFLQGIKTIPAGHRPSLPLWLDHFDSLWMAAAHAIPSATAFGVKPEVSLYDHSRTTAALGAALWRWHEAHQFVNEEAAEALKTRSDFGVQKFLLVQGDFFGIQDFIFASGGKTGKQAAKLLRGRSMQVSLFTEAAAVRIMENLGLPPTSQVINAAGKFLIVAPNTEDVRTRLSDIRQEFRTWFEENTFGMAGIGLAWEPASCADFLKRHGALDSQTPFSQLIVRLYRSLDREKHRRFDLASAGARIFDVAFPFGPCAWNGRLPADRQGGGSGPGGQDDPSCAMTRDQIRIGEAIAKGLNRLLIVDSEARRELSEGASLRILETPLFGYSVAFTRSEEVTGKFGPIVNSGALRRCWDFSAPGTDDPNGMQPLFAGYAKRFVSGHVPTVQASENSLSGRYTISEDELATETGELKTLDMLACEDRTVDEHGNWRGVVALAVLKGDIDDLGEIFRLGMSQPSFAKWASLSRQVNGFFAIYLPWLLAKDFPGVYTVFAGGDDFFLIGPWKTVQSLASRLRDEFSRYVAGNESIHFSVGIATMKPGSSVNTMTAAAEDALDSAKRKDGKNAVTCFSQTVSWQDWQSLQGATRRLGELRNELDLSTGYVYGLLQFIEMQHRATVCGDPSAAMWRSRFAYRTRRMLDREFRSDENAKKTWQLTLTRELGGEGIEKYGAAWRIPLFNHLYQFRDR
jgi:CRISPR-associated protein Csm1